jgi:hypothetical protein
MKTEAYLIVMVLITSASYSSGNCLVRAYSVCRINK